MSAIGMMQQRASSPSLINHQSLASNGVLSVCFAPVTIYVIVYGNGLHFAVLFVCIIALRMVSNYDLGYLLKEYFGGDTDSRFITSSDSSSKRTNTTHGTSSVRSHGQSESAHQHGIPPTGTSSPKTLSKMVVLTATTIVSVDSPVTKLRRGLLNKISPDKLDDLISKLVDSFDLTQNPSILKTDAIEFFKLVFAACSRQPQYVSVFTELLDRVATKILDFDIVEDILVNHCQNQWTSVCLTPVEKSKGWLTLSSEDQMDLRTRHKSKQIAIAEFCGQIGSQGLIPPSFPLSWLESLMSPVSAYTRDKCIESGSHLETIVEIVCSGIRGLGPSEMHGYLTEVDGVRFAKLCKMLAIIPTNSSRIKCLIQDLVELRSSGWTKLPNWKQALLPTKRLSSAS